MLVVLAAHGLLGLEHALVLRPVRLVSGDVLPVFVVFIQLVTLSAHAVEVRPHARQKLREQELQGERRLSKRNNR